MTNTFTNTPKGRIRANDNTLMNAENFQGQEGLKYWFKRGKKMLCLVDIQKCYVLSPNDPKRHRINVYSLNINILRFQMKKFGRTGLVGHNKLGLFWFRNSQNSKLFKTGKFDMTRNKLYISTKTWVNLDTFQSLTIFKFL